jgi:hypothetical protein
MTTAGTLRTPRLFARSAISGRFMSSTVMSHDERQGLVTYYVLFFLHLESRRVSVAGITRHPDQEWMEQIARSATQETWGYLDRCRYVLHDRDTKFCASFRSVLAVGGVKTILLPATSPNLNAFAERCVRSVKEECLSKLILFGARPLLRTLSPMGLCSTLPEPGWCTLSAWPKTIQK